MLNQNLNHHWKFKRILHEFLSNFSVISSKKVKKPISYGISLNFTKNIHGWEMNVPMCELHDLSQSTSLLQVTYD